MKQSAFDKLVKITFPQDILLHRAIDRGEYELVTMILKASSVWSMSNEVVLGHLHNNSLDEIHKEALTCKNAQMLIFRMGEEIEEEDDD